MSRRDSDLLIKDILLAIEKINEYTQGINFEAFLQNDMIKDAVVRNIEINGDAANRISAEINRTQRMYHGKS